MVSLSKDYHFQIIKVFNFSVLLFLPLRRESVSATNKFINCNTFSKVRFSPHVRIIKFPYSHLIRPLCCWASEVRKRQKRHVAPLLYFLFHFPSFGASISLKKSFRNPLTPDIIKEKLRSQGKKYNYTRIESFYFKETQKVPFKYIFYLVLTWTY